MGAPGIELDLIANASIRSRRSPSDALEWYERAELDRVAQKIVSAIERIDVAALSDVEPA